MNSKEIVFILEQKHQDIFTWLENQPDSFWMKGPEGKWTAGQHILHLVNSIKMLNKALSLPKFLIKYKFGVANRPSRSYDEVAQRYEKKLSENLERAARFNQKLATPSENQKASLLNILQIQNKKLQYKTNKLKDRHLDMLILPHPLMGKMTVREIIMWTAHHTEHHYKILKEKH